MNLSCFSKEKPHVKSLTKSKLLGSAPVPSILTHDLKFNGYILRTNKRKDQTDSLQGAN